MLGSNVLENYSWISDRAAIFIEKVIDIDDISDKKLLCHWVIPFDRLSHIDNVNFFIPEE